MKRLFTFCLCLTFILSCENKKQQVEPKAKDNQESIQNQQSVGLPKVVGVSPNGDTFSLDKVEAKYILLDFWASWCGPCRANHPGLVAVYSKFKGKGIEFFSVSLDENKEKWTAAIAKDHLSWQYHICDFGGWYSPIATKFGINQIPNNILFDQKGNIIGQNIEPEELDVIFTKLIESKELDTIISH